tara:strand:- start:6544 stop:7239 length:696 start_codon:yes stop_codon:yes gene_type:complete
VAFLSCDQIIDSLTRSTPRTPDMTRPPKWLSVSTNNFFVETYTLPRFRMDLSVPQCEEMTRHACRRDCIRGLELTPSPSTHIHTPPTEINPQMPKIAEPTKLPPIPEEKIDQLCDVIREGLSVQSAAKFVELSVPQVEKWTRMYPALKLRIDKATADHEHHLVALATQASQRDGKLAIAILERRHGQWNKTDRQEIKQETQGTVSPELLKALQSAPERVTPRGDTTPNGTV